MEDSVGDLFTKGEPHEVFWPFSVLVLPSVHFTEFLTIKTNRYSWTSSLMSGRGARESVVKIVCSVHGSIYPTLLSIQKTLTRTNGNDTSSISLTLMRGCVVCGVFYSTNSSNRCPVGQLVLQKATLSHCESISSVEKESHIGPEAGIEGTWEPGREENAIVVK